MNLIDGYQTVLLYACVWMLGTLAMGSVLAWAWRPIGCLAVRMRRKGLLNTFLALLAVALMVVYGGEKSEPLTILSKLDVELGEGVDQVSLYIFEEYDGEPSYTNEFTLTSSKTLTVCAREIVMVNEILYANGYRGGTITVHNLTGDNPYIVGKIDSTISITAEAIPFTIFDANGGKFSNGAATKTVEAMPGNLWGKLPMPSLSGQVFDGWYTAKSGGDLVTSSSLVPNASATYYAYWTPRLGLAAASEWSGEFTTDSWCGQGTVSHDGRDALRSGIIYDNQGSYLMTKVTGEGTLTFWWAVSCEAGGKDALRLLVDGAQVQMISGDVDWTKVTVPITGSGTHTIKWNYTKNGSVTKGEDFGWIDQIGWAAAATEEVFVFDANGGKFSNGASVKKTDATPGNLWGKMYMPAKDGEVFAGWYTAKEGGSLVTSSSTVPNYYTTYYAHWTPRLGLAAASEWPLEFTTDSWCGQGAVSHDGRDALRSGIIYDGQSSYLITRVTGEGTLTFWWKVSCEAGGNDALRLLVDGSQVKMISGETDWAQVTVDLTGSGTHILKWNYTKNGSVTKGQDFGWIDQISWQAQ